MNNNKEALSAVAELDASLLNRRFELAGQAGFVVDVVSRLGALRPIVDESQLLGHYSAVLTGMELADHLQERDTHVRKINDEVHSLLAVEDRRVTAHAETHDVPGEDLELTEADISRLLSGEPLAELSEINVDQDRALKIAQVAFDQIQSPDDLFALLERADTKSEGEEVPSFLLPDLIRDAQSYEQVKNVRDLLMEDVDESMKELYNRVLFERLSVTHKWDVVNDLYLNRPVCDDPELEYSLAKLRDEKLIARAHDIQYSGNIALLERFLKENQLASGSILLQDDVDRLKAYIAHNQTS